LAEKRYYPVFLDLEQRRCLVVGGGRVARDKVTGLVECGARVVVVAPEILPELLDEPIEWISAEYRRSDLRGAALVLDATSDRAVNHAVHADAVRLGIPVNVADTPDLCTFILPAIIRRDPIAVAVSTGGASPALAQRLRDEIGDVVRPEHASLARRLAALRPWAKAHLPTYADRREFFRREVEEALE
jgi:precorrin-2 dehydrogenase/sirohydrochlorin ferrochelatase